MADVSVNGGHPQPSFVLRDTAGAYWIEEALADAHRVNGHRPPGVERHKMRFLPLSGFEGSTWTFHDATVSLDVSIPPRYIQQQVRTVRESGDPPPTIATGAFVDYKLFYEDGAGEQGELFSALFEPTLFGEAGVFRNAFIYRNEDYDYDEDDDDLIFDPDDDYDAGDGWIRLESTFVRDDPTHLRSLRIGDGTLMPGMLGVGARFGGVQLATNFDTRPNLVTFPLPQLSGEALLNSEVDLFINGRRALTDTVAPGPFRFDEIPVSTGGGAVQLVTRDLTGREQVITTDFYVSQRVLREGLSEYAYSLGALRRDYGVESNDYGNVVLAGFHRYGVSDRLTAEGQGQLSNEVQRAAAGLTVTRPRIGVSSAGLALSHADESGAGFELVGAHEYRNDRYRFTAGLRYSSDDHRQVNTRDDSVRPELRASIGGGYSLRHYGSFSATVARQTYHDTTTTTFLSASYSRTFRGGLSILAYGTRYETSDSGFSVGVTVSRSFGNRRSSNLQVRYTDDGPRTVAETQRSLPQGPGLGYRFAAGQDDGDALWESGATLHTRTGRYAAGADHDADGTAWRASASGSAAWIGGMPFLTREVRDAFAVVKVNGFEGVEVYLENQPMGRTDSSGRILLPGLRPFEANRVRIEMQDLPLNARIDGEEKVVTPYAGAGTLAEFPASEGRDVFLRLLLPDGEPARQGGYVRVDGNDLRYPVGLDGAVYLRDVEDSVHAVLHWGDQRCGFALDLAGVVGLVPDLGDVVCGQETMP
jgi:outer membrane usher protein